MRVIRFQDEENEGHIFIPELNSNWLITNFKSAEINKQTSSL